MKSEGLSNEFFRIQSLISITHNTRVHYYISSKIGSLDSRLFCVSPREKFVSSRGNKFFIATYRNLYRLLNLRGNASRCISYTVRCTVNSGPR